MQALKTRILSFARNNQFRLLIFLVLGFAYWYWLPKTLFSSLYSKILLDQNNELLAAQIAGDGQWRFPQTDSVPPKFKQCILLFEDEYFNYHPGFNPVSIVKSLRANLKAGRVKSGGSTITMQVARMMRNHQSRNMYQKLVELFLAIRIELSYKKSSILCAYTANAPFGGNVVGLTAASWRYFGRNPNRLSWAESAMLAVLPNAPSLIYPGKGHQKLLVKRNRLLAKLKAKGIIDASTYNLSIAEPLPQKPFAIPQLAPHLLNRCVKDFPAAHNFESTIDKALQLRATELLNRHVAALLPNQINNACALIAETSTGKVLAYIGNSYSEKNEHQNYVDIIESPRSTGSILKPFLYAFMLNENRILPASLLEDVPIQIGSYGPRNFNLDYDGVVPANLAITRSLNVPAIKMLQDYGVSRFHHRLKQLGFTGFTQTPAHYGLSLILGGGEASLWDLASAYASMGRALNGYSNSTGKYLNNAYHPLNVMRALTNNALKASRRNDLLNASAIYFTLGAMTELLRPQ